MGIQSLIPLAATIIYLGLLIVIVINRRWERQHKLLAWYLIAASFWTLSSFFLFHIDLFTEYKLLLFRIVTFTSIWWAVQLYYFARSFLHLPGGWAMRFGYASLVVFGTIAAMGYAPPAITSIDGLVNPVYGWWYFLYVVPLLTLAGMGVYSLAHRLTIVTDPRERNKIAYLIIAICLVAAFGFISITPLAKGYPVAHVGALFSACILTYAVTKHELVSINAVLRRGLGWASLFVLGIGAYLLVFYFLNLMVGFELEAITLALATLSAVAAAILVYWLRPIFLGMVEQLFFRETYSYRQALLSFSSKTGNIINLNDLANEMLLTISNALRITQATLLFEDSSSGDFTTQFTYPNTKDKSSNEPRFNLDNPIVTWLKKEASPLDLNQIDSIPQLKGLWQTERGKLIASNLELLCPIKSRGKLIGILALGRKQSGTHYSHEDIELVMSLASQAGIIIENARMFDSLKKQQLQVEQLLTQTVVAQEEERQRISADLHDSVAQWLVAASYRAQTASALLSGNNTDKTQEELANMESTITKSVRELRRIVIGLRPPALDELGLPHALRQSLEDLKTDGLVCIFNEAGTPLRLSSNVEIVIYRIVQEVLTNVRKHANASNVNLRLQFQDDKITLTIHDNGKGFDLSQTLNSAISVGHTGLLGMKQRAEMLGGDLQIRTGEGRGTTITLSLPLQPQGEQK